MSPAPYQSPATVVISLVYETSADHLVDNEGIEPSTTACKTVVFPLTLIAQSKSPPIL